MTGHSNFLISLNQNEIFSKSMSFTEKLAETDCKWFLWQIRTNALKPKKFWV